MTDSTTDKTTQPWIILHGNPIEGFQCFGPFSTKEEAERNLIEEAWIMWIQPEHEMP